MEQFTIEINIDAESEAEAIEKLEAFQKMDNSLEHGELVETCDFIESNPEAIERIKEWITNPPPAIKMVQGLLFKKQA